MGESSWDEVGQRFGELGRYLGEQWREAEPGEGAKADARAALDQVTAALDRYAEAITGTVNDAGVRDSARDALGALGTALSATLDMAANAIDGAIGTARDARHRDND